MRISFSSDDAAKTAADVMIVPSFEGKDLFAGLDYGKALAAMLVPGHFAGKARGAVFVNTGALFKAPCAVLSGIGPKGDFSLGAVRNAIARAMREDNVSALKLKRAAIDLRGILKPLASNKPVPPAGGDGSKVRHAMARWIGQAVAEGAQLGAYVYEKLFAKDSDQRKHRPQELVIIAGAKDIEEIKKGAAIGEATAFGQNLVRDMVNDPSNLMRPGDMERTARKLAKTIPGLSCNVLNKAKLEEMGAGALLGVNGGSSDGDGEARLICIEYHGGRKSEAPLCFVGKGLTFDSGGYDIKPADGMLGMKCDMGGGACVMGALAAVAKLKLPLNVVGVVPTTENLINENATQPGAVHTSLSGKTIEINNTDAEGRLILADALTYTQRTYKPDTIVDLATLTGAVVIALGDQIFGVMTNDDGVADEVAVASKCADELSWRLPLPDEYDSYLDSTIADVSNITGVRAGGTITAGLFLRRFIDKGQKWAHLDIAAIALNSGKMKTGVNQPVANLATGMPVRTLVHMARERAGI